MFFLVVVVVVVSNIFSPTGCGLVSRYEKVVPFKSGSTRTFWKHAGKHPILSHDGIYGTGIFTYTNAKKMHEMGMWQDFSIKKWFS